MTKNIVDRAFGVNILVMKIFGLLPYDCCPQIYKLYASTIYFMLTVPAPMVATIYFFDKHVTDITKIAGNACLITEIGILIVKQIPFKIHPKMIQRTIYTLESHIFTDYFPEQDYIMRETIERSKKTFRLFFGCCCICLITWPLPAMFSGKKQFPLDIWTPFNPYENNAVYWATFLWVYLACLNSAFGNCSTDTLIAGLICHAGGQIKILKNTLENIGKFVNNDVRIKAADMKKWEEEELRNELTYKLISKCIDHYSAIHNYVLDLENVYSFPVFIQLSASILIICISLLQLTIVEPLTIPFFVIVFFVGAILVEILLFCYFGTELYEESNTIINAIYMSEWYNFDEKSKKALCILMEKAKRPMKITAGKLLGLSLETFAMIIRRSYSLLAVLKNY